MKVILLKDVRGVGLHGTIQNVSDGYAVNKLFPQKLAVPATEDKMKEIEEQAAARAAQLAKEEEQLDNKVAALRGKRVAIAARATEKGGLFKTVSPADVIKAIRAEHSLEIPAENIYLPEHIKTIGEHQVLLKSKNQKAELIVSITASV